MNAPPPAKTEQPLQQIADTVRAASGLVVDSSRRDVLARVVDSRGACLRLADRRSYAERIATDPEELQQLVEELTIGETYFARIPPQIRALSELVLPALLARGDRKIRIWTAGCSTGEETYTVAMLLAKLLPADATGWDVRLIGTDINRAALAAAREGRYGTRAVGLLADDDLQRYFTRDGNAWRVGDRLRELVEFRHHNLASGAPPAQRLDLILCRNVLIYFQRAVMRQVVASMHDALVPGGWLLLGHSETLWRLYDGFTLVRHDDAFLYRKPPQEPVTVRRPPPLRRPLQSIPAPRPNPLGEIREALSSGAYAAAADLAADQIASQPLSAELHYLHGLSLVEIGEDQQALVALRRAAYLDPGSGFAQFLLAVVLGRLGHGAEAARAYGAAAQALSRRGPDERARELGGRRVDDLAAMCRQLSQSVLGASHDMVSR